MYGYIYETTNLINGKKYVGQHKSQKFDKDYLGSGKILRQAVLKYGFNNFKCVVLYECNSQEEMNELEIKTIKEYKSKLGDMCYNISTQAGTWNMPENHEVWNKGIKLSDEYKHKISEGTKKAMKNPEVRQKILARNDRYLLGNTNAKGKRTEEQRKRISEATKKAMNNADIKDKVRRGMANRTKEDLDLWKKRQRECRLGRLWYSKGDAHKQISKEEEEKYILDGWHKGRK